MEHSTDLLLFFTRATKKKKKKKKNFSVLMEHLIF
jgi:hypothetical protein